MTLNGNTWKAVKKHTELSALVTLNRILTKRSLELLKPFKLHFNNSDNLCGSYRHILPLGVIVTVLFIHSFHSEKKLCRLRA